jgi:hypothetical protein
MPSVTSGKYGNFRIFCALWQVTYKLHEIVQYVRWARFSGSLRKFFESILVQVTTFPMHALFSCSTAHQFSRTMICTEVCYTRKWSSHAVSRVPTAQLFRLLTVYFTNSISSSLLWHLLAFSTFPPILLFNSYVSPMLLLSLLVILRFSSAYSSAFIPNSAMSAFLYLPLLISSEWTHTWKHYIFRFSLCSSFLLYYLLRQYWEPKVAGL